MKLEKPWSTYQRRINKFFSLPRKQGEDVNTGLARFLRDQERSKPSGENSMSEEYYEDNL